MNFRKLTFGAIAATAVMAGVLAINVNSTAAQSPDPAQPPAAQAQGYRRGGNMDGMMARGRMGGQDYSLVTVAATTLGMERTELLTALNGGKTIADVAQDKGVDLTRIVDAAVAQRATWLQEAVKAGRITQTQADTNLAAMKANVTTQLSAKFTPRGNGTGAFVDADGDGVCDTMPNMQPGGGRGRWDR